MLQLEVRNLIYLFCCVRMLFRPLIRLKKKQWLEVRIPIYLLCCVRMLYSELKGMAVLSFHQHIKDPHMYMFSMLFELGLLGE